MTSIKLIERRTLKQSVLVSGSTGQSYLPQGAKRQEIGQIEGNTESYHSVNF